VIGVSHDLEIVHFASATSIGELVEYAAPNTPVGVSRYERVVALQAQGALVGYVHPFDTKPRSHRHHRAAILRAPDRRGARKVDYLEVMGYSDHLITSEIWYRLLNCGFRLPARRDRCVPQLRELTWAAGAGACVRALRADARSPELARGTEGGRTFVTNAPMLEFALAGHAIATRSGFRPRRMS